MSLSSISVLGRLWSANACLPHASGRAGASSRHGGAFLSARISRVTFGTDNRQDVVKYVIAVSGRRCRDGQRFKLMGVGGHHVVLLHGQPGSGADWQQVAERLPGGLGVVT